MWEKKRSSPGGASRQGEDKVRMADIRGGTKRSATLTFLFWRWCWSQGFSSFLKNPCSNAMEDPIYYAVKSSNWKLTRETKLAVPSWWSSGLSCLTKSNKGAPFLLFTECLLCLCVRVRERERKMAAPTTGNPIRLAQLAHGIRLKKIHAGRPHHHFSKKVGLRFFFLSSIGRESGKKLSMWTDPHLIHVDWYYMG